MKKLNTVTCKNLINVNACDGGVKWFKKNYPKGIRITKQNMEKLITKLLNRKTTFFGTAPARYDTALSMAIFVDAVFNEMGVTEDAFSRQLALSKKEYIKYLTSEVWMYIKQVEQE